MSGGIWEYLGVSGSIWEHLIVSGSIEESLGVPGSIWECLGVSGSIWQYGYGRPAGAAREQTPLFVFSKATNSLRPGWTAVSGGRPAGADKPTPPQLDGRLSWPSSWGGQAHTAPTGRPPKLAVQLGRNVRGSRLV